MQTALGFKMLVHLLLVALPFAAGLSVHRSSTGLSLFNTSTFSNILQLRQNKPKEPQCTAPCTGDTCDACSAGGSLTRRDLGLPPLGGHPPLDFFSSENTTAPDGDLHKRLFTYTAGSTDPNNYVAFTIPDYYTATNYIRSALRGGDSVNFGGREGLMWARGRNRDERAVAKQREFKDKQFQILTDGVYGCTVLVLVSQRAVWMTHLWEIYSNGQELDGLGADYPGDPAFHDRVIKFMKGETVTRPQASYAPYQPGPYVPPSGRSSKIKAKNFNSPLYDRTQLFIFTPVRQPIQTDIYWEDSVDMTPENINQPNRYGPAGEVVTTISTMLGFTPQINLIPHTRLDMRKPEEQAMLHTSIRGTVTFQYDPNCDGQGTKAWRLFMEARMYAEVVIPWVPPQSGGSA